MADEEQREDELPVLEPLEVPESDDLTPEPTEPPEVPEEQPDTEPDDQPVDPEAPAVFGLKPPDDLELPSATDDLIRQRIEEDQGPTGAEFAADLKELAQQQEAERANLAVEIQGPEEETRPPPRSFSERRESAQRNTPPGFEPQIQMQNLAGRDIPAPAVAPPAAGAAPQQGQAPGGQAGNEEMTRLLNTIADSLLSLVELTGETNTKLDEIKEALEGVGTLTQ